LQLQLVRPVSALLVLYSGVVPHERQLVSPASAKVCAGHVRQTALLVLLQLLVVIAPAPQAAHAEQGKKPEGDHKPAAQG